MKYRTFGKTGLQVSALGFGCMRFPVIDKDMSRIDEDKAMEMVRHAIDNGVNYFDTAYPYHTKDFTKGGSSEPFLAKALKYTVREKVYIATKLPSWMIQSRTDMDEILDKQLQRLDTGYIDFYMLHGLNRTTWDNLYRLNAFEFLNSAIQKGKIKYAGFSFHDEFPLFKEIVDAYDWTFCQIQYNYFDEYYQAGKEGLNYAAQRDLAVVVMEPLRGGSLVKGLPPEVKQIFEEIDPERSVVEWALRWLWNQPDVSIVLSGMSHIDQVKENIALAENISEDVWTGEDGAVVEKAKQIITKLQRINCTACGYCLPCPSGVNIPRNFALYNDHFIFDDPNARYRYNVILRDTERASSCTQCGQCEEHCPQHISIPQELEHVAELFA